MALLVVTKIIFNKYGKAKKVQFIKDGKLNEVRAKKAVILTAGINNSKILQLSGIGSYSTLKNAGIKDVFINENVGQHLKNHPSISITLLANPSDNGVPSDAPYAYCINNVYLPAISGASTDPRMLQILFQYIPTGTATYSNGTPLLVIRFSLLNPNSEGSINIQSNNPFQIASVNEGFYQDPTDLTNMKNAVKVYINNLLEQLSIIDPPFYIPVPTDPINNVILSSYNDTVVEEYVKNNTNLTHEYHHYTSHCKMAPLSNGGVVNYKTRVYGTKNVYIADDSICPVIPDINTTASAMMIGLRSSEILLKVLK